MASSNATLARPYAKAAFELAKSQGDLNGWDGLLKTAGEIVADDTVSSLLGNPLVARSAVISLITDALGDSAGESFGGFLAVLGDNDRLALLPEISELFGDLRQEAEKRLQVRVVSAVELSEEQASRMKAALAKRLDRSIELESVVDASVLGGAVIYAGDQVIDGSLKGRLEKLQAGLA